MNRFRVLSCALAVAAAIVFARPAAAQGVSAPRYDPAILAPIDRFIAAVLANSPKDIAAEFAPNATIIDDLPPDVFTGPAACEQWYSAFVAENAKQQLAIGYLGHGSPRYLHVSADHAYLVLPADFTYTLGGKYYAESADWTFGLVKAGDDWKIASWAWALLTDTSE
jgi:hypothetical protein